MRKPFHAYRTPRDPGGYPFGYNWRATAVGLVLLVIFNFSATQYIAAQFRFQPALGTPMFRVGRDSVYQPFAWCIWGYRNCTSRDTHVRKPLFEGEMIVLGGCILSMLAFFAAANRRARRLSENAEDLHGSARWATEEDIEATGLTRVNAGVYVGGWYSESARRLIYLRHNGPEHILAFAPTRAGKGVSLIIPTLLAWEESAVIYDIKGENWAKTSGFRSSCDHICLKFSPVEEEPSTRFNPLAEIRLFTARDYSDAQKIAEIIIRNCGDAPLAEPHWEDSATSLTIGMILHACYSAAAEERTACIADLVGFYTRPGTDFRDTLNEMLSYPHDPQFRYGWKTRTGLRTATHPTVSEKAQEMLNKDPKEMSGVLSTAITALTIFSDPLVVRNTSASDFGIPDLVNQDRPVSLYIVIPPADKVRLRRLVRLVFTVIVNRLSERMEFAGSQQKWNKHRLLFMIDEFPTLDNMDVFADALSYMAGYGLKAYLIAQDIRQIVEAYGVNESIVSNCQVRVAFAPNQIDTAEVLSKMAGTTTVQKASFNFSGSRFSPWMSHINASVDHIQRPLMTPDEIMRIKPPKKEGSGASERITEPGDMLIFVSGHNPILGMQMLYFSDPELARRVAIPPPSGAAQSIPAPHVDAPEFINADNVAGDYERSYVEEMR